MKKKSVLSLILFLFSIGSVFSAEEKSDRSESAPAKLLRKQSSKRKKRASVMSSGSSSRSSSGASALGSSDYMVVERDRVQPSPVMFAAGTTGPLKFYREFLTQFAEKSPEFFTGNGVLSGALDKISGLEFAVFTQLVLDDIGVYVSKVDIPGINLVKAPFTYSPRVLAWNEPEEALQQQKYYQEGSPKQLLLHQLGEKTIIAGHAFPMVADLFIEWSAAKRVAQRINALAPGFLIGLTWPGKGIKECRGFYTWAPRPETIATAEPEFMHRTFMVDQCSEPQKGKSGKRQQERDFQSKLSEDALRTFLQRSKDRKNLQVEQIYIDIRDGSIAFVTFSAAFIVSPTFPGQVFVIYRPREIKGEKKSHFFKTVFDESGSLQYKRRSIAPSVSPDDPFAQPSGRLSVLTPPVQSVRLLRYDPRRTLSTVLYDYIKEEIELEQFLGIEGASEESIDDKDGQEDDELKQLLPASQKIEAAGASDGSGEVSPESPASE